MVHVDEVINQSGNSRTRRVGNDSNHFGHIIHVDEVYEDGRWQIIGDDGYKSPFGHYIDWSSGRPVVKESDPTR